MTSIRKGFVFCTFLVLFWAIIGLLSGLLGSQRFGMSIGMPVFFFFGVHILFFWVRIHSVKKRRIVSFIPSFLPGFFSIFFFYQWIATEAYLGCPVTDDSCEDSLSPALFISAVVFLSSLLYSTFFELSLRHSNPKRVQVNQNNEREFVEQTNVKNEISIVPIKTNPEPDIFRKYAIQGVIVVGEGLLAFGIAYGFFGLVDYLIGHAQWALSDWISIGIYALVLSALFLLSQRTKWPSSLKAALIIPPIIIWMSTMNAMGYEISSQSISVFGTILIVTGPFCYIYFTKKPWQYYLAIAFATLFGAVFLK